MFGKSDASFPLLLKIVLVAVSLIPLALASGYEEHGYGGGGDHYDKGYEAHVSSKRFCSIESIWMWFQFDFCLHVAKISI